MAGYVKEDIVKTVSNQTRGKDGVLTTPSIVVATGGTITSDTYGATSGANIVGNKIKDSGGTSKIVLNPTAKTIVDGSATALFDVTLANSTSAGGMVFYLVQDSDGTDFQTMSGMVSYAVVDKAGTKTLTITDVTANNAKAVSSGTLTLAWTFVTGTGKATVKLQPTGSLTETSYTVTYTVFPLVGAITIL